MSAENQNTQLDLGPATQPSPEAQPEPRRSGQEVFEGLMQQGEIGAQGFVPYTREHEVTGEPIRGWETREARAAAQTTYLPRIPEQRSSRGGTLAPLPEGHMPMRTFGEYPSERTLGSTLGRTGVFGVLIPSGKHRAK